MKTAYIFHDAFSDPVSEWYPWMKISLESLGYFVSVPQFPTPAGQSLASWEAVVKSNIQKWDSDTIIIGHGAGGAFALRMVEKVTQPVHGLFLVASYGGKIGHAGYDRVNETFFEKPFDWSAIKNNAMIIESFSGESDPFVPVTASEELAKNLGVENHTIPSGGHVTHADGFTQCIPVLQGIKESMSALEKTIAPESIQEESPQKSVNHLTGQIIPQEITPDQEIKNSILPSLAHTMYQDMSHLVNSNKGSVASSLLSKAREDEAVQKSISPKSTQNILYIVGTVIIIGVALGIIGYVLYQNAAVSIAPTTTPISSLILADSHIAVDTSNKTSYALAAKIREVLAKPVQHSSILDIVYTNGISRVSLKSVLTGLGTSAPDTFSDELNDPTFMHGEISDSGIISHFIVIPINHYDSAFTGMHDWEPTLVRDLGIFFGLPDAFIKTLGGTKTFTDVTVQNHPVRALYYHTPAPIDLTETLPTSATPTVTNPVVTTSIKYSDYIKQLTQPPTVSAPIIPDLPNPQLTIVSPYKDGDLMLAYFFINEHTLVITDSTSIIPKLLERYANSQIYK
jgi:predicted alpha/beta hydrolase family esterase